MGAQVDGLQALVRELRGPLFKDINRELRAGAKLIANDIMPTVRGGVLKSAAPQAPAMANTIRVHSDRVPVVVVGKVNPRFMSSRFRGGDTRRRRGAMALGVVAGPAGGKKSTEAWENYYHVRRSSTWGPLGQAMRGPIMREGEAAYLKLFIAAMKHHGFDARTR